MKWEKIKGIYYSNCSECQNQIKSKLYYLNKHSGKCRSCASKKEPFYHLFNKLKNTAKQENKPISLMFNDFLEFTKIKNCHYCLSIIEWNPYCYKNNKYVKGAYYLDRKNNEIGYVKENLVVCCTKCNIAKGNRYSYNEWNEMNSYFRNKR